MGKSIDLRLRLAQELKQRKQKNHAYSLRAFAKSLDLSPATLSEVINGRRGLTGEMSLRVARGLGLNPFEIKQVKTNKKTSFTELDQDHYFLMGQWYYFAILSLGELDDFQNDPHWVAHRLGIQVRQAKQALKRLVRLELIVQTKGRWHSSGKAFKTSDNVRNLTLQQLHLSDLELAKQAIVNVPLEQRDVSAVTMAIDPQKIPKAKEMIQKFRAKLCTFLESGDRKEVYKMCIQLFPLTKEIK